MLLYFNHNINLCKGILIYKISLFNAFTIEVNLVLYNISFNLAKSIAGYLTRFEISNPLKVAFPLNLFITFPLSIKFLLEKVLQIFQL